jgi:hypothetical protein
MLATIAYRTQKALRDAPESFGAFDAGSGVRTPADLVRHMTAVMGYARSCFGAGRPAVEPTADLAIETVRLHSVLADVSQLLESVGNDPDELRSVHAMLAEAFDKPILLMRARTSPYQEGSR